MEKAKRGNRLYKLRQQLGLPIAVLAHKAGCSASTLHLFEKWGIAPKRYEVRERIARALGVDDPDWLFEIDSEEAEA